MRGANNRVHLSWRVRALIGALIFAACATLLVTNHWLSQSLSAATRNRAELRLTLYAGNMMAEIQRTAVIPLLLADDPVLTQGLRSENYTFTSHRLIKLQSELGTAAIRLLDQNGKIVGATDRSTLGQSHRGSSFFIDALRSSDTIFTVAEGETGFEFIYSRAIQLGGKPIGVLAVNANLRQFERSWSGFQDTVLISDSTGNIILSTRPQLRGKTLTATIEQPVTSWWSSTKQSIAAPLDAYIQGKAVMRTESRIPFRGWRMITLTAYDSIRERINGILALEIMGFALILAITFYFISRREMSRVHLLEQESQALRALNIQLNQEIAMREQAEKDLAVAELTLVQASKLSVLGEMSAAVSHELNQPLTAMKTYLAGARLLLQRRHHEEALVSFQRIDDLIERMRHITRQLKSYARKGSEQLTPIDLRNALSSALSMMEPTLKASGVPITQRLSATPVMVMADQVRLEQVIINVLRNAIDATAETPAPQITIHLVQDRAARLVFHDNGAGITNIEKLFEPFYTTKKPGKGVGLGLAISSTIMNDFGGRLTARNALEGGAVFEMILPALPQSTKGH